MILFSEILGFSWAIAVLIITAGTIRTVYELRSARRNGGLPVPPRDLQPISIIKPLKGLDPGVKENLESFFHIDYPKFELLFCVGESSDPVIPIVQELIARYPHVQAHLRVGSVDIGPNPKINNMITSYDHARYDWILINDSNMRATPDYLRQLARGFADEVAMQGNVIAASGAEGFGGKLETMMLNTFFVRGMYLAVMTGKTCVMGKSMMYRKSQMESTCGLRSLSKYLSEDYLAGLKYHQKNLKISINAHPAIQHIGKYSFKAFWARHVRWGRMRKTLELPVFAAEPLLTSTLSCVFGAIAFKTLFGVSPWVFVPLHFALCYLNDLSVMLAVGQKITLSNPIIWIIREFLHLPLWITIASSNTVIWRGQPLKVEFGGTLAPRKKSPSHFWSTINPRAVQTISAAILALVALATALAGYSLKTLNTEYSMRQFMPPEHPLYKADVEIKKTFGLDEELPMLITLQLGESSPGDWLTPARVTQMRSAQQAISSTSGIKTVTSLVNLETAETSKEGISVGNMLNLIASEQWKEKVQSNPLLSPGLISADHRTVMFASDVGFLTAPKILKIVTTLREKLATLFPDPTQVKALVGGVLPLQSDMSVLLVTELRNFLILGFVACMLTLFAYFRSFSSVIICLILVFISNIGALSGMALMGVSFSILSTTLPVLASITALAIGAHTLLNFGNEWQAQHDAAREKNLDPPSKLSVIRKVYGLLVLPNFLMSLTTAIGFATLGWSEIPMIRNFSWSVTSGIMISWLLVSVALPPLMYFFPIPVARSWTAAKARWVLWVTRSRVLVLGAVFAAVGAITLHGVHLNWSVRLFDDLPSTGVISESAHLIDASLGGMMPLEIMLKNSSAEKDPWNSPDRIEKLRVLLAQWREIPGVGSAIGISDFLKAGEIGHNASQKDSRQSIAETIFLYSMGENNPIAHYVSNDGNSVRISLRMKDLPADELEKVIVRVESSAKAVFPEMTLLSGGMGKMAHPINAELSRQLITGLWSSLFWISLLMIVVFRSLRWALVAAVPNLLAPFALIATMGFLQTPIKPAVAILFSIALGVAYNNTVYVLARLKSLSDAAGPRKEPARLIDLAWYQEANPCMFSSLALLGGFAVFLTSYFSINRVFGAYMLWAIGVGLFGDLVFLPALLRISPNIFLGLKNKAKQVAGKPLNDYPLSDDDRKYAYAQGPQNE